MGRNSRAVVVQLPFIGVPHSFGKRRDFAACSITWVGVGWGGGCCCQVGCIWPALAVNCLRHGYAQSGKHQDNGYLRQAH
jgi:hypothetical protein